MTYGRQPRVAIDLDWIKDEDGNVLGFMKDARTFVPIAALNTDPLTGKATGLIDPKDGSVIALGGKTADSINSAITVYNADGTTSKRCMPKNERLISKGVQWFAPTALSGTAARSVVLDTTDAFVLADQSTAPGVIVNCLTAGFVGGMTWATNLAMPSDGLLQALFWVDDYENGQPWATGSLVVTLTGASGNIAYTYAATTFRPGLNTLQLWNPATAANAVCSKTGVSTAVNSSYNFTDNITQVGITVNNMTLNANLRFAGIWTQTKVKPMLAVTFDVSATDIFTNFIPAWQAAGYYCSLRSGGTDFYRSTTYNALLLAAYNAGHDVYNGSWTRLNLTQSTTSAQLAKEVGLQANYMQQKGYKRGATLFSSAGNALPKASVYRDIFPKFGIKSAKGGTGFNRANMFGPAGLDDRYYLTVQSYGSSASGAGGINAAKEQIDGIIYTGGLLMWFMHDCPTGRPSVGSVPAGNGGGIYAEDVPEMIAYLQGKGTAIEVVTQSTIDNVLDGLA